MTKQEQKKYSFNVFEGWSTEFDGNQHHTYTIIAYTIEQMDKWLHDNYDLKDSEDNSGFETLEYSKESYYTKNGNPTNRVTDNYQTDYVTASQEELTEQNLAYLKSGKYWTTVIDLTEESN